MNGPLGGGFGFVDVGGHGHKHQFWRCETCGKRLLNENPDRREARRGKGGGENAAKDQVAGCRTLTPGNTFLFLKRLFFVWS